jgi:hypothetical protein
VTFSLTTVDVVQHLVTEELAKSSETRVNRMQRGAC